MKRTMRLTLLTLLAAALQAGAVEAQSITRPFSFGAAGGVTVPTRDGRIGMETGYHVEGMIGLKPPMLPIGLRADVVYHRLGFEGSDGSRNMFGGIINATYDVVPTPLIRPYLIAGVGMYNFEPDAAPEQGPVTQVGFNGGAGVRLCLAGMSSFVETRYYFLRGGSYVVMVRS